MTEGSLVDGHKETIVQYRDRTNNKIIHCSISFPIYPLRSPMEVSTDYLGARHKIESNPDLSCLAAEISVVPTG